MCLLFAWQFRIMNELWIITLKNRLHLGAKWYLLLFGRRALDWDPRPGSKVINILTKLAVIFEVIRRYMCVCGIYTNAVLGSAHCSLQYLAYGLQALCYRACCCAVTTHNALGCCLPNSLLPGSKASLWKWTKKKKKKWKKTFRLSFHCRFWHSV